jgi:hypothetical protein
MFTEHDIETTLTESKPTLDAVSRGKLWSQIEIKLATARPVHSPFLYTFIHTWYAIPILFMLTVVVSTGGVALAAESSRPGDLLFPVERAVENVRLSVAFSPEKKDALMKQYSDERLSELREIIDEEIRLRRVDEHSVNFESTTTLRSLQIEADVFADTTVVKVELNDGTTTFETDAETRNSIAEAVLERFPFLTKGQVESSLTIENEDRKSRPKDRGDVELTGEGSVRVGSALTEVLTFIDESEEDDDDTTEFLKEVRDEIDGLTIEIDDERVKQRGPKTRFEWKIHDSTSSLNERTPDIDERVEWRNDAARVRIEERDGRVRIDIKEDDHSRDDNDRRGKSDDSEDESHDDD